MVKEIVFYIEGGGDAYSKTQLRKGFGKFLGDLGEAAQKRGVKWRLILCGARSETYEIFIREIRKFPEVLHILLVDSEGPVSHPARLHLSDPRGDNWDLSGIGDDQCYLMAQAMEAWLIADPNALTAFYGQGFQANALPRTHNVEEIPKEKLESSLKTATRNTKPGPYHKTQHAPQILERLDPAKVRPRAPHCERLFFTILKHLS